MSAPRLVEASDDMATAQDRSKDSRLTSVVEDDEDDGDNGRPGRRTDSEKFPHRKNIKKLHVLVILISGGISNAQKSTVL